MKPQNGWYLGILFCIGFILTLFFLFPQPAYLQEKFKKKGNNAGLSKRPFLEGIHLPLDSGKLYPLKAKLAFPFKFKRPLLLRSVPLSKEPPLLAVVEQEGKIWLLSQSIKSDETPTLLIDIKSQVCCLGMEEGLLGLAFHPKFEENGYFYVYYSTLGAEAGSRVSRFTASRKSDISAEAKSELVLMEIPQPYRNHNGGCLEFGPDGYLYIGLGDGGSGGDPHNFGQNLSELLGSILRIDVDQKAGRKNYQIPADNPFVDDPKARGEIWAYGLRNPWRFSFDRLTGQLWAGDVGQNKLEEIDLIIKGGNYGWKIREGSLPFDSTGFAPSSPLIDPVWEYPRTQGVSVTGGYVYRGKKFPELYGAYLFADFQSRKVWAIWYDGSEVIKHLELFVAPAPVASFGEDHEGELYLCAFDGKIYRWHYEDEKKIIQEMPPLLSKTGLFENVSKLLPNSGLIPYSVNTPLWSDGAEKIRYLGIPNGQFIGWTEKDAWSLPIGTILVKHFQIRLDERKPESLKKLETRVLLRGNKGWEGYTYRWKADQQDAVLLEESSTEVLLRKDAEGKEFSQTWYYPSRTECFQCHTQAAGSILGLTTPQMNKNHSYLKGSHPQLSTLNSVGLFYPALAKDPERLPKMAPLDDSKASFEHRANSYLAVNCSFCHRPEGSGLSNIDFRFETPLNEKKLINSEATQGNMGISDGKRIVPQKPESSILWLRMKVLDQNRMPTLASKVIDQQALDLLRQWIQTLPTLK